jgi:methylmalonyl-CoA carboxyltransferase small subunit
VQLTLTIDSKKYVVDVEIVEGEEVRMPAATAPVPTATITSQPVTPVVPVAAAPATDGLPDDKVCRSPIAGVVFKVTSEVGQEIKQDDLLLVLEAMKMETNITAHVAGKIKAIHVSPGEAVKNGQVLVEFE